MLLLLLAFVIDNAAGEKTREENVLGRLELDVRVLPGVEEQVLVVGGLLDDVGAQSVAHLPVVEVVEGLQPLRDAGGLAVGARSRDRVPDVG